MSAAPQVGDKVLYVLDREKDESLLVDWWWERTRPGNESLVVREPIGGYYTLIRYRTAEHSFGDEDRWSATADSLRVVERANYEGVR